jgi:hypothetical protein
MTYAAVKRTDGSSVIVSNSVLDSGGGSHTVANDALNSAGAGLTVFFTNVEVNPVQIVNFRLSDVTNRVFRL